MLIIAGVVAAQQTAGTTSGTLDPAQVYNTTNLVNNTTSPNNTTGTWQNVGLWNQGLPCWGPGGPVYCGPNPYFNNGSFNFSYGLSDVNQSVNINNALSSIGSGLRVNGYNFGFLAKNGNGWDDGRVDYLVAYVNFTDSTNKLVYNKSYDLNYKFNWTYFNFSETFNTPFASKDLGTATYGFVGKDNNYWAGPYGPEITNISFSLKYSVDPCAVDVLSSPSCPGYLDALLKTIPTTSTDSATTTTTSVSPASSTTTTIVADPIAPVVTTTSTSTIGQVSVVAPVVSAPVSTTTSSTPTTNTTKESNGSSGSTSLALSIISKNQDRDNAALSVAQSAMSQAAQSAQQAQQEAAAIASNAVENSQTSNIVSTSVAQSSGNGIRINNVANLFSMSFNSVNVPGMSSASMLSPQMQLSTFATPTSTTMMVTEQSQTQQVFVSPNTSAVSQTAQSYAMLQPNFLTDKSNPLTDIIEGKQNIPQTNTIATVGPSVNKNVGDNDVAGGVDINKMALAPIGYGTYLNFTLRDATFYAPKEVYRNQRNVDNARALRQLTNDGKHREMVELQYAK